MKNILILFCLGFVPFGPSMSRAQTFNVNWMVISSGGASSASPGYMLSTTVGQTAIGPVVSPSYKVYQGFWQDFSAGTVSCCNLAGDANNSGVRNILDVTYIISYLYKGGPPHPNCHPDEMNANGVGAVNILDATYLIAFLYKSGPTPVCP